MSRSVIVGAVVVVLGAIAAVIWTQSGPVPVDEGAAPAGAVQEAPTEVMPATADDAAGAVQDAVEGASGAAAEAAQEAISDAVEGVTGAGAAASDAAGDVVDSVTETTTETVTGVVDAAEGAASDAAASVSEALSDTAPEGSALDGALTADGFDADAVLDAVENSDLGALQKTGLSALVEEARNNPDLIDGVISQVKEALGL